MKKILSLVLLAFLALSCSQDEDSPITPSEKLFPVKFSAKLNFYQENTPLTMANYDSANYPPDSTNYPSDSITYEVDSIYYRYLVYSATGTPVKQLKGIGTEINDNLAAGCYKISIIASTKSDLISSEYDFYASEYITDKVKYPKAFYTTFEYCVDSITNSSNSAQVAHLDRMWGEIDLEIMDKSTCYIPSTVSSLTVKVVGASPTFFMESLMSNFVPHQTINISNTVDQFRSTNTINCLASYSTGYYHANIYLVVTYNDNSQSEPILLTSASVKKGVKTTLKGNLGNILQNENNSGASLSFTLEDSWGNEVVPF